MKLKREVNSTQSAAPKSEIAHLLGAALEISRREWPEGWEWPEGLARPYLVVRRIDNPDYVAFQREHPSAVAGIVNLVTTSESVRAAFADDGKGFRGKKGGKGAPVIRFDAERLGNATRDELRAQPEVMNQIDPDVDKLGAALHLVDAFGNVTEGEAVTVEDKLALLGFWGIRADIPATVSSSKSGVHYFTDKEIEAIPDGSPMARFLDDPRTEITRFNGPTRGSEDQILTVKTLTDPQANEDGTVPEPEEEDIFLSSALLNWAFRAAREVADVRERRVKAVSQD